MTAEKTTRKKPVIAEEPKVAVCKGHNQLHMCFNCHDMECKTKGFFKMHRCKNIFYWIMSLAGLLVTLIGMIAAYVIIRINDGNWADIKLPVSLLTIFFALAFTVIIIVSTIDFKHRSGDAIYE